MRGTPRLMAELLYGTGLRVTECMTLRIKDLDFRSGTITVRSGKGTKDRTAIMPTRLSQPLQRQVLACIALYKQDVLSGRGYVPLPGALHRKYPAAARSVAWQFVLSINCRSELSGNRQTASLACIRVNRAKGVQGRIATRARFQACCWGTASSKARFAISALKSMMLSKWRNKRKCSLPCPTATVRHGRCSGQDWTVNGRTKPPRSCDHMWRWRPAPLAFRISRARCGRLRLSEGSVCVFYTFGRLQ